MLEFLEDLYVNNKEAFNEFRLPEEGEETFEETGDPRIDELERMYADGEDIGIEDLERILGPGPDAPGEETVEAEEFRDDYTRPDAPKA